MNVDKIPYSPFEEYSEDDKSPSLRETVSKYVFHWPLFMLSIALCFALAFLYLRYATPVYDVRAKLLIKDEKKTPNTGTGLEELDLFQSSKVVENEIEILKSRTLMREVVKDLHLWTQYKRRSGIKDIDIYSSTPVRFTLLVPKNSNFDGENLEIFIKDKKSFVLKHGDSESVVPFTARVRSGFGIWKLETTPHLDEYIGKTVLITLNNPEKVTGRYLNSLDASLSNKQTTVVDLNIKESVPKRGEDILNRLITVYNLAAIEDKNKVTQSTLDFIDERLASLTGELTSVEKDVESFKSSRGLTDISLESEFFLTNVSGNDAKLNEVNVQLQVINGIEDYVNSPQSSGTAPATLGISDPGLLVLINQLSELELQKEKLLAITPESNPVFGPINNQIQTTKNSIRENVKGIKKSLLAARNQLLSINSAFESSIKQLPGKERQFISIKRQQGIKEELYIYLLQKREETAVSYASTIADSRTVDQAFTGDPVSPKKPVAYGMAFVLSLALPVGLIYVRNVLNDRVNSSKEISETTSVPILGELCYSNETGSIVVHDKSRKMIAEQFRILRTNLQYIYGKKGTGKVTLFTSSMSGEGKSFVTCNLGAALAVSGRKTIILELDMRKPAISKYLNVANKIGLSNYLIGECNKEDIVQTSSVHPHLFVISTGPLPPNPSELLEQPEMDELINWLKTGFDEILIDTPPIHLVTDAMILSRFSDANLFVVRHGYTYKSQLDLVKQLHREQKLPKMNIIYNGVNTAGKNGYGYYGEERSSKHTLRLKMKEVVKRF